MAAYLSMGEAHRRIGDYLSRVVDAISSSDGAALASLIAVSSAPGSTSLSDALATFPDFPRLAGDRIPHLADLLVPLLRAIHSHSLQRFADAYSSFEKAASAFLQEFRSWETPWAMEAMHTVAFEIRLLAEKADRELATTGKNPDKLQAAGSFLMKVFGALAVKGPKRIGALYVTCQLFKIYFRLGTVNLCRSVIRSIETARNFDFEDFPVKDKVTYMYYTGRLEVFNENFLVADQKLTYALMHCNPQSESNLRRILKFLIPVKLSIGVLPKRTLLETYNLLEFDKHVCVVLSGAIVTHLGRYTMLLIEICARGNMTFQYADVVTSLKRGDLRLLRQALDRHEDQFLKSGVYLVLEKLELQVYQRLVKKIHIIQRQKEPAKAHQIKLDVVVKALKWLEIDMDLDEVECIMACLIYKNLIKGYFAHKSKVLVLSKQDPFPKLNGKPV
ncbi:Enhanced ethylene response protein 5 [Dichanthelium oligosanthes]|uniref:Enhanced ethylene response protein 5 n=1 Tax=Dichanthelium oligosanthes TaxID=888268 RepID=A0A1E5VSH4_9POAL|nr:Enhanced ethylene response protein 5 [Dichanthelium oligosanthes]